MHHRKTIGRLAFLLTALMLAMVMLAGCGSSDSSGKAASGQASSKSGQSQSDEPVTLEELEGKRVGIQTGTVIDKILPKKIKDVKIQHYEEISDLHEALLSGKVDAISADQPTLRYMAATDPQVAYRKEVYEVMDYGYILNKEKNQTLREELNTFIAQCREDGTIDEMTAAWFDPDKSDRPIPDYESLPATNGKIRFAVDATVIPFVYVRDGAYAGYEVELMARFCEAYGYALEIDNMQFGALLPAVNSGRYDVGGACITITPERAESVDFSDPTYEGGVTVAVKADGAQSAASVPKAEEYAKKRIAIMSGTNFGEIVTKELPEAEQVIFNSVTDMVTALKSDKVDAVALDEPVARAVIAQGEELAIAEGYLDAFDFAFVFAKNEEGKALGEEVSAYLREIKADGTMEELQKKWFDSVAEETMMSADPNTLPDTNGTIQVATLQYPPFTMMGPNMFFGYEVELLTLFGQAKGYRIEFIDMDAAAVMPAVQSGKCAIGAAATSITEERKEQVYFSEPDYSGGVVLLIPAERSASPSFMKSLRESFHKTFIRENRYRLFAKGVGMTLLIAILSAIFGTALGFLIFMACRRGNAVANILARVFSWLMAGMPVVVLLMILFYIVFVGKLAINGAAVAVIGFTLVFGAEVYGMMSTSVGAVDHGQVEAAYALGYTDRRAFFRHVLPQAMPHFMPAYRGSLVSLVKSTSIVGYVAVQDLTKMGDIVRSRTYEAFFPLIAVAIIYFILGGLLVFVINRVTLRLDPTRRNKEDILKGIKTHD